MLIIQLALSCHLHVFFWPFILGGMILEEDVVEGIGEGLESLDADGQFQLTLPDGDAVPAHLGELSELFPVKVLVAGYYVPYNLYL